MKGRLLAILVATHGVLLVASILAVGRWEEESVKLSFAIGAGLQTLLFGISAYTWSKVFAKKHVARPVFLSVIRYAILGGFTYFVLRIESLRAGWFCAGILVSLTSVSVLAVYFNYVDHKSV